MLLCFVLEKKKDKAVRPLVRIQINISYFNCKYRLKHSRAERVEDFHLRGVRLRYFLLLTRTTCPYVARLFTNSKTDVQTERKKVRSNEQYNTATILLYKKTTLEVITV